MAPVILAKALDGVGCQPVLLREVSEPALLVSAEAAFTTDPERAVLSLQQTADQVAQQAVGFGEGGEPPILVARQTVALATNPEAAVVARAQRADPAPAQFRRRILTQRDKTHAVEPRQSFARPHPQIAIGSLGDGIDQVLRQPVIRLPCPDAVRHNSIG